jgi:ABC-type branched-subunit amino acid transport system ATPase component
VASRDGAAGEAVSVLTCADIRACYDGFVAVEGVSFSAEEGHVLGIAGPNGAGKTTLFDVISGYHKADGGRVELRGRQVTHEPVYKRAREGLARTFQSPIVPNELTVGETFEAARIACQPRLDRQEVRKARELVGLAAADGAFCGRLESLERRKLLLACLLMRRPAVLLLDEPASGLLQSEIDEVDRIIRSVTSEAGVAVVVVEHRLELLYAVAERVLVMDAGRSIAEGPPDEVFNDPAVRAAYFEAPRAA